MGTLPVLIYLALPYFLGNDLLYTAEQHDNVLILIGMFAIVLYINVQLINIAIVLYLL
jgi:hypothetical protein